MELSSLTYHRPADLHAASRLALELGTGARILAGGTDLLVDLKQRRTEARHVIAVFQLAPLRRIWQDELGLHIGALATLTEIARSAEVGRAAPALAKGVLQMAAVQIRNRATIGGNFCAAVPCADTPPICLVYGATLVIAGSSGGSASERRIPAQDFFLGPRRSVLASGEILAEIVLEPPPLHTGAAYQRFSRRRYTSLAVAGSAARLTLDGDRVVTAKIALASVAPTPRYAPLAQASLEGQTITEARIAEAARLAATEALPITDLRGSVVFRRDLVAVLTRRALTEAWQAALAETTAPALEAR